jgi:hypothetical protein
MTHTFTLAQLLDVNMGGVKCSCAVSCILVVYLIFVSVEPPLLHHTSSSSGRLTSISSEICVLAIAQDATPAVTSAFLSSMVAQDYGNFSLWVVVEKYARSLSAVEALDRFEDSRLHSLRLPGINAVRRGTTSYASTQSHELDVSSYFSAADRALSAVLEAGTSLIPCSYLLLTSTSSLYQHEFLSKSLARMRSSHLPPCIVRTNWISLKERDGNEYSIAQRFESIGQDETATGASLINFQAMLELTDVFNRLKSTLPKLVGIRDFLSAMNSEQCSVAVHETLFIQQ